MANRRGFLQGAGALAATLPLIRTARSRVDARVAWERAPDIARNVKPPTFHRPANDVALDSLLRAWVV